MTESCRRSEYEGDFLCHIDEGVDGTRFMSFSRRDQNGGLLRLVGDTVHEFHVGSTWDASASFRQKIYITDGNGSGL